MLIKFPFKIFVLLALIFTFVIPNANAQPQRSAEPLILAQNQPSGEVDFKVANQEAIKKLHQMTAEEIEALDKKLAKALILYYDRNFARALPIFREIADQVETMDLMFWIGSSAMKVGDTQLAIDKFKRMLAIDPKLHRVRLELAATYFGMGRYEKARLELETVQAASPPAAVRQNIEKMLAAIEERTKKVFYNLRASVGVLWDDNASSGPEQQSYQVAGGTFTPGTTTSKLRDTAKVINAAGNVLYDVGENKGLMWNTTLSAYNKAYSDYGQFNYLAVDFTTGPWWAGQRDILKIPFGFFESEYESDRLSRSYHLDPNYEYYFNQYFSLKGLYSYTNESYHGDLRSDLDNRNQRFELTPSIYFKNRKHIVSVNFGYEDHDAHGEQYSYVDPYFACSYLVSFSTKTELFFKYKHDRRDYKGIPTLYNQFRLDDRRSFTAVLSQEFAKYFFASVAYGYIKNHSNLDLYDWDKTTYTVSIGCKF